MDVVGWLEALGLGQYARAFAENKVDFSVLAQLTDADLKELGVIPLGDRKRLLTAIAARGTAVPAGAAAAANAPPGERRQVAILFADLSGFTALSQSIDPEELHALIGRYTKLVDDIVVGYGGTVDKHIGDAVMALFGAPVAHEDDPLRAARTALDIHKALAELSDAGRSLQAHVGIASGEVVAATLGRVEANDYTAHGDSVNLAARLVAAAAAGQTLVSDSIYRELSGRAVCDAMGDMQFKGIERPVRVWRLRGIASEPVIASRTPFVGRDAELKQVNAVLDACLARRNGQIVYVRGEAGIGKTRLVEEARRVAEAQGFAIHRSLILSFGMGKGQDPIRNILGSLLNVPVNAGVEERIAAAERAVATGIVPNERLGFLYNLLDLTPTAEWAAHYDAMDNATRNRGKRELVTALAQDACKRGPIVVIVEDLHWADPEVLGHLAVIASGLANGPGVLLMTSRVEGDPLDGAWRASCRGTPFVTIDLGPLRREEALSLAGSFVDASTRTVLACIERADGNPLFLEQLLRNSEEGSDKALPASIQSLVLAQMDRLAPPDRQAFQAASVIGQRFDLALLRHLAGAADYVCDNLVSHALVLPEGEDFLFAHALIYEGAYSSLLHTRRRELHRAAAEWFAARDAVLHAQHLDRAEDARAAKAYLDAATAQRAAYHADSALRLTSRGLEIAKGQTERHALICLKGELERDLGDVGASIASYRDAVLAAPGDVGLCQAQLGLAEGLRFSDGLTEALDLLDAAQTKAEQHDLVHDLARLHHLRGNILFPQGKIEACREQHQLGLDYAKRAASPEAEARALGGLGDAAYAQGRIRTAFALLTRCCELSRQHGFGRIEVANRMMTGNCLIYLNQPRQGRDEGAAAARAAALVGQPRAELLGVMVSTFASSELGAFDQMKANHTREVFLIQQLGARRFEPMHLQFSALVLFDAGRRDEAGAVLREALAICRDVGMQFYGPAILGVLARTTDSLVERDRLLSEGEDVLRRGSVSHNHLLFYREAIEAMLIAKDAPGALHYAAALEDYTRDEPLPWSDIFIARGRALASALQGPIGDAERHELARVRDAMLAAELMLFLPPVEAALAA